MDLQKKIKIPNKSLFKVEEVCELVNVKPYILRFWESEFSELQPLMSSSGQKLYEYKHLELLLFLKKLLVEDKLTVAKAKRELKLKFHAEKKEAAIPKVLKNAFPAKKLNQRTGQGKHLSHENLEKLVVAKDRLDKIMAMTESLQKRYHWTK